MGRESVNEQVVPIRGFGEHAIELAGVGAVLEPGDELGLVVQSANRFFLKSDIHGAAYPVSVAGQVRLPTVR